MRQARDGKGGPAGAGRAAPLTIVSTEAEGDSDIDRDLLASAAESVSRDGGAAAPRTTPEAAPPVLTPDMIVRLFDPHGQHHDLLLVFRERMLALAI